VVDGHEPAHESGAGGGRRRPAPPWCSPGSCWTRLNRQLKGTGWHFPVDVSTSANATIGGMTATLRRHAVDQVRHHGPQRARGGGRAGRRLAHRLRPRSPPTWTLGRGGWRRSHGPCARSNANNAEEIALGGSRSCSGKVVAYNLETLASRGRISPKLMVGSGRDARFFTRIKAEAHRIPKHKGGRDLATGPIAFTTPWR